jgi:AcrR family transcriptional regulator
MDLVAKSMAVSKPVLYSCFASREELLLALLEREEQRLFAGVMSALPGTLDLDNPKQMMIAGFQALLRVAADYRPSWQLVFASTPDIGIADRYGQARRLVAQRVSELMRPGLAAWKIDDIDRKLPVLVELFMSIGDGAVRALVDNSQNWTAAELGEFIGLLTYGALKKA